MPIPALIGSALISGASNLVGGAIAGLGAGAEKKKDREYQKQLYERSLALTKPKTDYYYRPTQQTAGMDRVLAQAILGNMQSRMGDRLGKWGIDMNTAKTQMGLGQGQSSPTSMGMGGSGTPMRMSGGRNQTF